MTTENKYPWWDSRTRLDKDMPRDPERDKLNSSVLATPKTIYDYLNSRLYGCEAYKKSICTAIWSSLHLNTKTSFLVIGPSGCGKTELARILSEIYSNMTIFDASTVSPVSFKGNCTISDCLTRINTDEDALPPWVFIDEIDKAILKDSECGPMIMNELLKMTEGGELYVGKDERNRVLVDTSRINFVFMGTFACLKKEHKNPLGFSAADDVMTEDSPISREVLQDSALLSNEFLGRINGGIIEVEPMDEAKAAALLADKRYSPVKRLEKMYQIMLKLSDQKRRELIGMTAKYGVRGIYSELQSRINDAIFEDCTVKSIMI